MDDDTDITVVSHAELRAEIAQGAIHILDVLPPASYATRHIPGATNMPFAVLHATVEAALLIFSLVVSKFVSRRQAALLEEVHRVSFEDRLSRVHTNLHQVLVELQNIDDHRDNRSARERILC